MRRKKLLLITPMLHQGGFERICAMTAKLLKDTCDVHIAVFTKKDMFYDVTGIDLIDLALPAKSGKINKIVNIIKRTMRLRALKKRLGIDISYSFGTTANIVNVLSKAQDITWAGIRGYGALTDRGMRLICKRADRVVSCTRTMERDINQQFAPKASATLYNPCNTAEIRKLSNEENSIHPKHLDFIRRDGALIVSMGREDDVKGFWHLLKAVYLAKKTIPDLKLMIIGDGAYTEYRKLAKALGIQEDVLFTGVQKNSFALLKQADVYALTSESEGFPNALIEAMAVGLPCISVNCLTGPAEILHSDYRQCADQDRAMQADYGILTGIFHGDKNLDAEYFTWEEEQFADSLTALLLDKTRYRQLQEAAVKRAEMFGVKEYLDSFQNLIEMDLKENR